MTKRVKILQEKKVFEKAIFRILEAHLQFERYAGNMSDEIVRLNLLRGDSAAALVHNRANDVVVMTEQFRYPTYHGGPGWIMEIPAGMVEPGEEPGFAIEREIHEEIGYRVSSLKPIGNFYLSPGGSSERIHLFYAAVTGKDKLSDGGGVASEEEDVRTVEVAVDDALTHLVDGRIIDAKTIIALQWLRLNRESLESRRIQTANS